VANTYFSNLAVDDALTGISSLAVWCSLHTASPGTTGASEVTGAGYARVQTTWSPASGSLQTGTQCSITVPASTLVGWFGIWDSSSGGNYYCGGTLPAQETFTGTGVYQLTPNLEGSG
jgi:hypothetical protein